MSDQPCRLYLVSPPVISDTELFLRKFQKIASYAQNTAAAIACFQLRLKECTDTEFAAIGRALKQICQDNTIEFLLNDRAHLVNEVGADGVHLGQEDMPLSEARALLGPNATIGITCHDSRHLAMQAGQAGADYVAFGAFFPTKTKQVFHHPTTDLLSLWAETTTLPCVAIGGITPENGASLVKGGADFLAVSAAIWQAKQPVEEILDAFGKILSETAN
ncbi:MAG: thiamine phosphate synthase [bacterium]